MATPCCLIPWIGTITTATLHDSSARPAIKPKTFYSSILYYNSSIVHIHIYILIYV